MGLKAAIKALCRQETALTDLIGQRAYPVHLRAGTKLPALSFHQVSKTTRYVHKGRVNFFESRIQFTVQARDVSSGSAGADQVEEIASVLEETFDGKRDLFASNVRFHSVRMTGGGARDGYDPETENDIAMIDFMFRWSVVETPS